MGCINGFGRMTVTSYPMVLAFVCATSVQNVGTISRSNSPASNVLAGLEWFQGQYLYLRPSVI